MMTLGWSEEYREAGIAANSLWPATTIDTAAVRNLLGGEALAKRSRRPEIVADAAAYILRRPSAACSGHLFTDEEVLAAEGITDLTYYNVDSNASLYRDLFLD
jgi:citronellol/citronellal dehydrogenase